MITSLLDWRNTVTLHSAIDTLVVYRLEGNFAVSKHVIPREFGLDNVPIPQHNEFHIVDPTHDMANDQARDLYHLPACPQLLERPTFKTLRLATRWLWFAHARDALAATKCVECDGDDDVVWQRVETERGIVLTMPICVDCADSAFMLTSNARRITRIECQISDGAESLVERRAWNHNALIHRDLCEECHDCNEINVPENLTECQPHGEGICTDCRDENYIWCNDFDTYVWHEDVVEGPDGEWYGDSGNFPRPQLVRAYNANVLHEVGNVCFIKNTRVHLQSAGKRLLFGVELETDVRRNYDRADLAQAVMDLDFGKYGICKEDSTVSGIEMVTLPCDLESHLTKLDWGKWCDALRPMAKGHHGRDNGLHIHMSRASLPPLLLGKLLVFFNNPKHSQFLSMVAQRDVTNSSWAPQSDAPKFKRVGRAGNDPFNGKYSILNVTDQTAECRMFNSTLLADRVYKNLEFLQALFDWCVVQSARPLNLGQNMVDPFVDYVKTNRVNYPTLSTFIANRLEY